MTNLPEGTPITQLAYREMQGSNVAGFVYPKRDISAYIPLFPRGQRAALSFYVSLSLAMFVAGLILPFILKSWWWLTLIPAAIFVWRANRKSMEQFFLSNLRSNAPFYEAIRNSKIGPLVKLVTRAQMGSRKTEVQSFRDTPQQCFANVVLEDGSPCFISVAQDGVLVKQSKTGISGPTLYVAKSIEEAAMTARGLSYLFPHSSLPEGMTNIALRDFTNACLHCSDAAQVTKILDEATQRAKRELGNK